MTKSLIAHYGRDTLNVLRNLNFTLQRAHLPYQSVDRVEIKGMNSTDEDIQLVDSVYRTLYEYCILMQISPTHSQYSLMPLICMINHSCDPNAMWVATSSVSRGYPFLLVAIKDIGPGQELTVSYCRNLSIDTDRHVTVPNLYDLLNDVLCQCGSGTQCVHHVSK
jgi:hypothetical protein